MFIYLNRRFAVCLNMKMVWYSGKNIKRDNLKTVQLKYYYRFEYNNHQEAEKNSN